MLTVACWKWKPAAGSRVTFTAAHVNTLRRMVARHYQAPHRFVCVTDDPAGLDSGIGVVPLWADFADVPNPHGREYPNCYRRLRAFGSDMASVLGGRFVSIDLDVVLTGDVRPLWDRPEPFVIWTDAQRPDAYNGSMFLLTAGARPQVLATFDPKTSPALAVAARHLGSDQGWIRYALGPHEARWDARDGVYSYRLEVRDRPELPANARAVFFHGAAKPWDADVRATHTWVAGSEA